MGFASHDSAGEENSNCDSFFGRQLDLTNEHDGQQDERYVRENAANTNAQIKCSLFYTSPSAKVPWFGNVALHR